MELIAFLFGLVFVCGIIIVALSMLDKIIKGLMSAGPLGPIFCAIFFLIPIAILCAALPEAGPISP